MSKTTLLKTAAAAALLAAAAGASATCTISCAWSCRFRKKPGMSRVLIGSIRKSMPRSCSAAQARFST